VTLVDTNVLLDLVTNGPTWADWSIEQLELASVSFPPILRLPIRHYQPEQLDEVAPGSSQILGRGCQLPVHINARERQNGCKREKGQ
jgi:hypothetical protein